MSSSRGGCGGSWWFEAIQKGSPGCKECCEITGCMLQAVVAIVGWTKAAANDGFTVDDESTMRLGGGVAMLRRCSG